MKKRYHLIIAASCCVLASIGIGICINSSGVFFTPVSEYLGVGRGAFAFTATLFSLTLGICTPFALSVLRKYPVKPVMSIGIAVTALATASMAFSTHIVVFFILSVIRGAACSLFNMAPITIILGNWFEKRLGLVTGIIFSFSGLGGAVSSAAFSAIIQKHSWQSAYLIMGAVILAVALPAGLLSCYSPDKMGLLPYGRERPVKRESTEKISGIPLEKANLLAVISILVIAFAVMSTFISSLGQHLPGYATDIGLSAAFGATMVSFAMIGNVSFKLVIGTLSDRFGPVNACTVMVMFNLAALSFFVTVAPESPRILFLLSSLFYGSIYSICAVGLSLVVRYVFGLSKYSYAYGAVTLFMSISGASSLSILGLFYDWFGTYKISVLTCLAMSTASLIILQIIRIKKRNEIKNGGIGL